MTEEFMARGVQGTEMPLTPRPPRQFVRRRARRRALPFCLALFAVIASSAQSQGSARGAAPPALPDSLFKPLTAPALLPFGYPANDTHKPTILEFIRTRRFEELEALLRALHRAVGEDIRHEMRLFTAFEAVKRNDAPLLAGIDAWIEARPQSADAIVARAAYNLAAAWRARGYKYIRDTPESRLRGMGDRLDLTVRDARAALAIDSTHLIAYDILLEVIQLGGSPEIGVQILQRGLAVHPASYLLRASFMQSLKPRWGGSYELMRAFADASVKDSARNPRMVTLRGEALQEQAFTLIAPLPEDSLIRPDHRAAIDSLTRALEYGPAQDVFLERGEAYSALGDHVRAFLDYREALILNPQSHQILAAYGNTLVQIAHRTSRPIRGSMLDRAAEALALAVYLDPADRTSAKNLQWARDARLRCVRLDPPCR